VVAAGVTLFMAMRRPAPEAPSVGLLP
jgi:hypothetical protein